ncbi:unnamed protein product [Durusdinium trenchii]|uniref:Uncharacterized protein n=1 Tax=Durusdinium trenchii TaxID=1381693 RepID=A0ABP0PQJ5_9DINO
MRLRLQTSPHWKSSRLNLEAVQELLKKGADATYIEDPEGVWGSRAKNGPLHLALRKRPYKSDEDVRGGSSGLPREWGNLPEFGEPVAEDVSSYREQIDNWTSVARSLIEAKADVNAVSEEFDWRGCGHAESAFDLAIPFVVQDIAFLELFLGHGADPNTVRLHEVHSMRTDGRSQVPILHEAVKAGQIAAVRTLLEHGAWVDAFSHQEFFNERGFNRHTEETALHLACDAGDLPMCALLLSKGAQVNTWRKRTEHVPSLTPSPTDDPRDARFVSSVLCVPIEETALHIAPSQPMETEGWGDGDWSNPRRESHGVTGWCALVCPIQWPMWMWGTPTPSSKFGTREHGDCWSGSPVMCDHFKKRRSRLDSERFGCGRQSV